MFLKALNQKNREMNLVVDKDKLVEALGKSQPSVVNTTLINKKSNSMTPLFLIAFDIFNMNISMVGIVVKGRLKLSRNKISLFKCYGPYLDHKNFQDVLENDGILKDPNLLLGGDLNLTLSSWEVFDILA